LSARRDLVAALLPARLGRSGAKASLRSPLALAWRLLRGTLLVWTVCLGLVGLLMGGVAKNVAEMMRDNKAVAEVFSRMGGGGAVTDAYLAGTMTLFGLAAAGYAVQATLKLRAEEAAGRAEPVLATAVGRLGWALGHLTFALAGSAFVLAVTGWTTGLTSGVSLVPAALAQLPAVWVLAGLAAALIGFFPRFAAAAWGCWRRSCCSRWSARHCSGTTWCWGSRRSRTWPASRAERSPCRRCSGSWRSPWFRARAAWQRCDAVTCQWAESS